MLEPADRNLVRRDPALPGLAVVLDAEALTERLYEAVPGLVTARPSYLRYKPATSVIAGLTLTTRNGPAHAFAAAYRPDRAVGKLAKIPAAGPWHPHHDAGLGLAIAPVEDDRKLPAVRRLLARPHRVAAGTERLTPLRYNPARRWVALADGDRRRVVKVHAAERAGHAAAAAALLPQLRAAGVACPLPHRHERLRGTVVVDWIDGTPLDATDTVAAAELGRLIASVHSATPAQPAAAPSSLRPAVDAIAAVAPDLTAMAGEATARCSARLLAERPAARLVHGDFSADQVIRAGNGLWLTDFDRMRFDDPAGDLGSYAAAQIVAGIAPDPGLPDAYRAAGGSASESSVRVHTAVALLRRAAEPFRRRENGWPDRVRELLTTAATMLEVPDAADRTALPAHR